MLLAAGILVLGVILDSGVLVGFSALSVPILLWTLLTTALRRRWKGIARELYAADDVNTVYWTENIKAEGSFAVLLFTLFYSASMS